MAGGKRAAVLIGVSNAGGLPKLRAVESGLDLMEEWARSQRFDTIERITDKGGEEVYARKIRKAVQAIVEPGGVTQLVVYFAGHGFNKDLGEYWLLTEARNDPNEAVNLAGTERLARYGTVPHVVFIADACRTAAAGIVQGSISGSTIFPTVTVGGTSKAVDLFYAASLGTPALEVADPDGAADSYLALYTDAFAGLLGGELPDLIEELPDQPGFGVVRPRPLRDRLPPAVVERLRKRNLDFDHSQTPDASVNSDPDAWLSRVEMPLRGRGGGLFDESEERVRSPVSDESLELEAVRDLSREALGGALVTGRRIPESIFRTAPGTRGGLESRRRGGGGTAGLPRDRFTAAVARGLADVGPDHYESRCGFKMRGARVAEAHARRLTAELLGDSLVRVGEGESRNPPTAPDSVLLRLTDGRAALLPAIPGFLASLTFEDGELAEVAYEPSAGTERWDEYRDRSAELRELRSLVTQSVRHGVFRIEGDDAPALAARIRYAKGVDPSLAVYAAWAFDALHRQDLVDEMAGYLRADLGFLPFDVALLSGQLGGSAEALGAGRPEVLPFVPLLARGWSLLDVLGVRLPDGLEDLRRHRVPSLWTLFDDRGAERLREHLTGR